MNTERDSVVNFLVEHLSQLLVEESKLLRGVKDRVKSLNRELSLIKIENSEGRQNEQPQVVKEVVDQIRDVIFEAEDVIDTFILKVAEQRKRNCMEKLIYSFNHTIVLWEVAKKIDRLKEDINEINSNIDKYDVRKSMVTVDTELGKALHKRRREVEENDVVGFVDDSRILVMQLTEGYPSLDVISIIGMGGMGKTVLARKIYNRVKEGFDCSAWVYVSQDFEARELLLQILKKMPVSGELGRSLEGMSEDELKERLLQHLTGKRFLVVMDDIWKTEVWDNLKFAFPNNFNGSRILITSRKKEVALHASRTSDPYFLRFLNTDDSWELFHNKVFRGCREWPPDIKPLARQIVESCHGLPLSIVELAGILSKKDPSSHIWMRYVGQVNQILTQDTPVCKQILSLSYTDLPPHLKPCFSYFGVYPKGFEIPVRQLIHLWIAEGFIKQTDGRHMEGLAEEYLEQLINRSLVQEISRRSDGGVKTCHINDLLQELYISESAEEKFLEVCTNVSVNKSRRLSVQSSPRQCISSNPSDPTRAHTLFFFGNDTADEFDSNTNTLDWVLENFKLIRVLHFEHLELHSIPERIGTLKFLRYLRINLSNAVRVPDSIGSLTKLETLYIRGNLEEGCLPNGIFKLKRLRNLYLNGRLPLPYHVDQALWKLQVLSTATLRYDFQSLNVVVDRFRHVRKLKIQFLLELDVFIQGNAHDDQRRRDHLSRLHHLRHLEILRIDNCPMLPTSLPVTITKLTLKAVNLGVGGGLEVLGKLPNLFALKIQNCRVDGGLHIISDSFPALQFLKLEGLTIREWELGTGAMPVLRHLVFKNLGHLSLPTLELPGLTALRNVEVLDSNINLATMLRVLRRRMGFKLLIIPPVGA